jgi:hypothetical protein
VCFFENAEKRPSEDEEELLCQSVDIYQIKDLLDHSNVTVTQRAYAHLQQNTLRTASEVVAKTLEEVMGRNIPEEVEAFPVAYR